MSQKTQSKHTVKCRLLTAAFRELQLKNLFFQKINLLKYNKTKNKIFRTLIHFHGINIRALTISNPSIKL